MKKKISTLAELEKEQEKLKMMMEVTRQEFAQNLGTNRKQLKNYILKNVALPAGAIGVGVAAARSFITDNSKNTKSSSSSSLLKKLIPLAINLFQAYVAKKQKEKLNNASKSPIRRIKTSA